MYLICQCYVKILSIIFVSIHVSMYIDKFIKSKTKMQLTTKKSMWKWWRQKRNKIKMQWEIILFVVFLPTPKFFTHMEKSLLLVKGCYVWPMFGTCRLSSDGSLTCHNYADTGHPFILVISDDPWHSHLSPSVWQWGCHYLF